MPIIKPIIKDIIRDIVSSITDTGGTPTPPAPSPTFYATLLSSLTLTNGTAASTFVRNTLATVLDWEGLVKTTVANEPRFQGARHVENMLQISGAYSENIDTGAAGWSKAPNVVLTTGQTGPDGNPNATLYNLIAPTSRPVWAILSYAAAGRTIVQSFWLKAIIDTSVRIEMRSDGSNRESFTITPTVADGWKRYSFERTFSVGSSTLEACYIWDNSGSTGNLFYITQCQCEDVTGQSNQNPSEYVSVGVESAPYHGANVDGVQYFETQNGNTVASNVVTEATGAALTTLDGYLNEELRTNQADTTDDLTGGADTVDLTAVGTGDYTLSVSSNAAVTVAAGTATGTGFGQAVAGTPVTFNLSVAGTVTLTLDSGTLTLNANGEYEYNLEKGSFATSWIPTAGTPATRNADVLTYDYQPPALLGSMLATVKLIHTDFSESRYVAYAGGGARYMFIFASGNAIQSLDATGFISISAPLDKISHKLGLTWEDGASPERATYDDAGQNATGALAASGYVTTGSTISIGGATGNSMLCGTIKYVKFFDIAQDQTFMETAANYE